MPVWSVRLVWVVTTGLVLSGCDAVHRVPASVSGVREVEAAVFEGGYGTAWHRSMAEQYSERHHQDGVVVRLWGDPRCGDKLKPRFLRRDPPDFVLENSLPIWMLIAAGRLCPLDALFDGPAYGSTTRLRDLFLPGMLDTYVSDGHIYALPLAVGAWSCWYDARLFREHGWSPPRTWGEFTALCERAAGAGIAPVAFQGKYPQYAWYTYITLVQRCGGLAAINRINAMEPDAFSQPAAIEAARLVQDLALRHFQKGALAMTHTESQLEFVNGHAALIFCGVWLENEMKRNIPPGFELRCFNIPAVEGGRGNPRLFCGGGMEFIFIPTDGRHPEEAMDFARFLVSPANAPAMGSQIGVISPLKGATPRSAVTPALQSVMDMMDEAPGVFDVRLMLLLLEWSNRHLQPNLAALLRGELSPEAFGAALDRGVAESRKAPGVVVPALTPYDPARYGEAP